MVLPERTAICPHSWDSKPYLSEGTRHCVRLKGHREGLGREGGEWMGEWGHRGGLPKNRHCTTSSQNALSGRRKSRISLCASVGLGGSLWLGLRPGPVLPTGVHRPFIPRKPASAHRHRAQPVRHPCRPRIPTSVDARSKSSPWRRVVWRCISWSTVQREIQSIPSPTFAVDTHSRSPFTGDH